MSKIQFSLSVFFLIGTSSLFAQENDSIQGLKEVVIQSFQRTTPLLETTTSIQKVGNQLLQQNHPERLMESINYIPGAQMEERSPGSYRLSLRGSTIRSPFGVRNVKIYFDDFLLTDATGNSYLNLIEPHFIQNIEILKGPQGGEYGSETGGVVVLNTNRKEEVNLNVSAGSYNMFSEKLNFGKQLGKHYLQIGQSHYQSDGYREQSEVKRTSFLLKDQWKYNLNNELNFLVLYTDMDYETPGGLTLQQMQNNRRQARLATNILPSAVEQKTGIRNKTVLGGINHLWKINDHWKQFILIQSSYTDFKNPFISNFEMRKEKNFQGRMFVDNDKSYNNLRLNTRIGTEIGYNETDFRNFDNNQGNKGEAQKFDNLQTLYSQTYIHQMVQIKNKLFLDASLSLNTMKYNWETIYPTFENGSKTFKTQLLPQFAVNYLIDTTLSIRGKIAKGFSSPTTEEVRSSNQTIQQDLNAEFGWNKEIGIRKKFKPLYLELTAFEYHLKDAIVRRQDENGNDYFMNSGGTKQRGLELTIESKKYRLNHPIFSGLNYLLTGHIYDFRYNDYQIRNNSFNNNQLPGISKFALQSLIHLKLLKNYALNLSHYYNSSIYLNDANTVKEKGYIIGNILLESNFKLSKSELNFYVGINNIYNQKYSLGYDLNAFGNRFYNPAATTNFYIGSKFSL